MYQIDAGNRRAYLDFTVYRRVSPYERVPLIISGYVPSMVQAKAFTAMLPFAAISVLNTDTYDAFRMSAIDAKWRTELAPLSLGYDRFVHFMCVNETEQTKAFITGGSKEEILDDFHSYLMLHYKLPLLRTWAEPILNRLVADGFMSRCYDVLTANEKRGSSIPVWNRFVGIRELVIYEVTLTEDELEGIVSDMLSSKAIWISQKPQKSLILQDMDSYFSKNGRSIVRNLEKQVDPLVREPKKHVDTLALKRKSLFGKQADVVAGMTELLECSADCIVNGGMGVGKTLIGASAIESYYVKKYLRLHPKETLKDVYEDPKKISYRVVIMCPGHLIKKWAAECRDEIPYAHVEILETFDQLTAMKARGRKRNGREFYVIGKDLCKLSYSVRPVPTKVKHGHQLMSVCECGARYPFSHKSTAAPCGQCGSTKYTYKSSLTSGGATGLVCPECGEILFAPGGEVALLPHMFDAPRDINYKCLACGSVMWQPNVSNLNGKLKNDEWYKITHCSNKAKKTETTAFVLRGYESTYLSEHGLKWDEIKHTKEALSRKVAPARYIKSQLKGFFDMFIADEVHLYKGSDTAQGNAMHALCKASKKVLALTGTIAGGFASHLYYMLWRLDSRRMQEYGYKYSDEMEFVRKYGTLETKYELKEDTRRNISSRGKKSGSTQIKPGISPLIFRDFLLDKTVFLDLSDMAEYLPPFVEVVETVEPDEEILSEYRHVNEVLRCCGNGLKNPMVSAMLQFSLSFLDKPYGYGDIIHPKSGEVVACPKSFDPEGDKLFPKEERLVSMINDELSEGRNCFVYAEYTGDGSQNVTKRLKEVIEKHCRLEGKVAILESSKPKASEREKWIHKKAKEGYKVIICNPRCVETGLDFIFEEDGVTYNYPTIFFYQLGYNLFTLWQASRRAYRLIQTEECRVYYMAYAGTIQTEVIRLMAEKQVATAAIQGKFSSEGLAAMSNGVDARVRLVQAMIADTAGSGEEELQGMFDTINSVSVERVTERLPGNANFYELLGIEPEAKPVLKTEDAFASLLELAGEEQEQGFDLAELFLQSQSELKPEPVVATPEDDSLAAILFGWGSSALVAESETVETGLTLVPAMKSKKKATVVGQLSLFGF